MSNQETTEYLTKITKIYNEIIKNYAHLNYDLGFENPIEIYTLFHKLMHRGYLSFGYNFEYNTTETLNNKNILGVDVINGKGVCRHISAMLQDIFDELKINNEILPIYLYEDNSSNKFHLSGNHVINLASQNNRVYFLDPTNGYIWIRISGTSLLTFKNTEFEVAKISNWIDILDYNNDSLEVLKNIKKMLLMDAKLKRQDDKIISTVNKIFRNNKDIFEKFKEVNKPLYNEIANNIAKIKTKINKK